ncbi:hypothetical protein BN940_06181 [Castellaniella defragrans 65Phen]|uniref:Uncharacterized protein n=1 Tax=Castellaniella defragrans (strain DSM 12143 / CCUG 39792 / 65Phen) TaxID=1437824 RepID=W8X8U9_CASD6|nr:hypothetical protein BN940_06181 [Castellaniella defragrans 65Phen]
MGRPTGRRPIIDPDTTGLRRSFFIQHMMAHPSNDNENYY